ncbi:MAG: HaeII family restriction endonuclease [Fimbriimonadales bacterium]|nr:HaeII family restriction endonuclease [Fimbriimonadales bacterium]
MRHRIVLLTGWLTLCVGKAQQVEFAPDFFSFEEIAKKLSVGGHKVVCAPELRERVALVALQPREWQQAREPIQIAEILCKVRIGELSPESLSDRENYRNPSKRWRDEVSQRLVGRVSTSSQKFQDNLFDENAIPPSVLRQLAEINNHFSGVVERYIYQQFAKRQRIVREINDYLRQPTVEFRLRDFLERFQRSRGLSRSIDKAYEITVYALFNAILGELKVGVRIEANAEQLKALSEFADLVQMLLGLTETNPTRTIEARLFRTGVANAADRGVDIWANFGPIVQVKHVNLSTQIAEDTVENTTADEIVIVCRDADAETICSVASQLGHRIKGIIQESQLISWYNAAFSDRWRATLGAAVLGNLRREFENEFPFSNTFQQFYKERGYDQIPKPSEECLFYEPDEQE